MAELPEKIRADKWLFHARFFKTRALAARTISAGHLRIDGARAAKPAQMIRPGVVLTFVQARRVRVVRVEAMSRRRGPAPEAAGLYTDLTPPDPAPPAPGHDGGGRPNRKQRQNRARHEADLTRRTLE